MDDSICQDAEMLDATSIIQCSTVGRISSDESSFPLPDSVVKSLDISAPEERGTLYKLLNRCVTPQGSRLLKALLLRPLTSVDDINERLDIIEYFTKRSSTISALTDVFLRKFPDIAALVKKLERKKISLEDLCKIYTAVLKLPEIIKLLQSEVGSDPSEIAAKLVDDRFVKPFKQCVTYFTNYKQLVETTIDILPHECRIKPNVSPELQALDAALGRLQEKISEEWSSLARDLCVEKEKTLKLDRDPRIGFLFRVTQKEEKNMRDRLAKCGIIPMGTKQAGYRFSTVKLNRLNSEFLEKTQEYSDAQEQVTIQLVETAGTFVEPLKELDQIVAPLDVFLALARVACDSVIPYVRPQILPKEAGIICLTSCRHPTMETFMSGVFIPNSVEMKLGESNFHIITGPNMGGKSTYIRQVALNVILAQIGSFVACESATISLVDGIFTRIGASDSVAKAVSTFMVEMLETRDILKGATKYSLVLIDELGRGTSTYDGYGLAYAISEYIARDIGSYCLFTTHFTELAELADELKNVVLSHVTAISGNGKDLVFTYAVEPGVCKDSFGINVADMVGIPRHVSDNAREILEELERASAMSTVLTI